MNAKKNDWTTRWLVISTLLVFIFTAALLWGAGLFRYGGHFLNLGDLSRVGSFIGGVFTPLAVGWAARSFLLQRDQMNDTLEEMRRQNKIQRESLDHSIEEIKRERDLEMKAKEPNFHIRQSDKVSSSGEKVMFGFTVTNYGSTALRVSCSYEVIGKDSSLIAKEKPTNFPRALKNSEVYNFHISVPTDGLQAGKPEEATVILYAERLDSLVSRYTWKARNGFDFELSKSEPAVPGLTMP